MSFKDVPEQYRAKRFLRRLVARGRLPHALLFTGMEGTGKYALAVELAKLLNCYNLPEEVEDPEQLDCCDSCIACRKATEGNHPDLIVLGKEENFLSIEQVRMLKKRFKFHPFEGRWRVVILKDAQDLRVEAANALLKVLEEPPERSLFILCAPEPQMLLPTIVSRCCHVRFQPLSEEWLICYLMERFGLEKDSARWIALASEGSLERALRWTKEDRLARYREVVGRISKLGQLTMMDFFALTGKWAGEAVDLEEDLKCIKLWLRNQLLHRLKLRKNRRGADTSGTGVENIILLMEKMEESIQNLRNFANKQLTLERACLWIRDIVGDEDRRRSF